MVMGQFWVGLKAEAQDVSLPCRNLTKAGKSANDFL
jgi:hypothetical protein